MEQGTKAAGNAIHAWGKCVAFRRGRCWCCEFAKSRENLQHNENLERPHSTLTDDNISDVDRIVKVRRPVKLKDISGENVILYGCVYDILRYRMVYCLGMPKYLEDMVKRIIKATICR